MIKDMVKNTLLKICTVRSVHTHEDAGFFAAWDFASNYRDGESYVLLAEKMTTVISGPKTTMTLIYHYNSSYLRFAFTLTQDSPRVDGPRLLLIGTNLMFLSK